MAKLLQFKETWQKLENGSKNRTTRLKLPGDYVWACGFRYPDSRPGSIGTLLYSSIHKANDDVRWKVGDIITCNKGRGTKAFAKIKVLTLYSQDARRLTESDAKAEGFDTPNDFLITWMSIHDKPAFKQYADAIIDTHGFADPSFYANALRSLTRGTEKYLGWVIEFERVE